MKELEMFLKNVADGLRSLANVVETMAEKTDELKEAAQAPSGKTAEAPTPKRGRKKATRPGKSPTAADIVYEIIKANKAGIDTSDLMAETGFDEKKVRNIIYKLKKQKRIKTAKRGIYIAA